MNLLPKSHGEFSAKEYWDSFFAQRGSKAFEWYGEYPELCGLLHKYIKAKDNTLVIGCGNSTLSADLYDVGYRNITNIDVSHVVIRQMNETHSRSRPELKYIQMDALNTTFSECEFSVVLDKGTLDALMPDETEETKLRISKLFTEIDRILRVGGRYICVSLLQEHILRILLEFFQSLGWMLRICRCIEAEQKTSEASGPTLPVFVVVCTKFKKLPNIQSVLEVNLNGENVERVNSVEEMMTIIRKLQHSALTLFRMFHGNLAIREEVSLELCMLCENEPRYTIHVLDKPGRHNADRTFAAFIVPQGRECEWLFGTPDGRRSLLNSTGYDRLAVVSLHRDQEYASLEDVKKELCDSILPLAPSHMPRGFKIPFLSVGSDVGHRKVLHKGCSAMSGEYVVEEVESYGGNLFRRLIFLGNRAVIQSEAKLRLVKSKGKSKKVVDKGYLACDHHKYMSVGIASVTQNDDSKCDAIVIGLGGGGLCSFLQKCFSKIKITAVDIDPIMLEIATEYFSLVCDEQLDVRLEDGLSYIRNAAGTGDTYHAVLFDVDSKTLGTAMSCPPEEFLDYEVLQNVKQIIGNSGIFILNLVCRSAELREEKLTELKKHFSSIVSYKLSGEVNEIMFCRTEANPNIQEVMKNAAIHLNNLVKSKKLIKEEFISVTEFGSSLKIIL